MKAGVTKHRVSLFMFELERFVRCRLIRYFQILKMLLLHHDIGNNLLNKTPANCDLPIINSPFSCVFRSWTSIFNSFCGSVTLSSTTKKTINNSSSCEQPILNDWFSCPHQHSNFSLGWWCGSSLRSFVNSHNSTDEHWATLSLWVVVSSPRPYLKRLTTQCVSTMFLFLLGGCVSVLSLSSVDHFNVFLVCVTIFHYPSHLFLSPVSSVNRCGRSCVLPSLSLPLSPQSPLFLFYVFARVCMYASCDTVRKRQLW